MIYTTNLDWLQLYCHGEHLVSDKAKGESFLFRVKDTGKETMQFLKLYYIYVEKVKVAEILQQPRSKIIHSKATIVKIENQILYTSQYMRVAYEIIKAFNLHYKGITRLDVCLDCTELAQGMEVQSFLRKTIALNESEVGFVYNVGRAHSTYNMQLTGEGGNRITGVKWGSPRSAISCYCYDKTLELIEQKDKPWIRKVWEDNGIDYLYDDDALAAKTDAQKARLVKRVGLSSYVKKSVWRFEISIKADGKDMLNLQTGEIFTLGLDEIQNSILIENLFFTYAKQCFRFVENTGQDNRRYFHPIEIFKHDCEITTRPKYWRYMKETGRSEKVCYNKLAKLKDLIPEEEDDTNYYFRKVMEFIAKMGDAKTWLYQQKKWFDANKSARTYKQELSQYWDLYEDYRQRAYHLITDPPTQTELNMHYRLLAMDSPNLNMSDESFWKHAAEIIAEMQSPKIVIPEGAERLSNDVAPADI